MVGGATAIGKGARAEINRYSDIQVIVQAAADSVEDLPPALGEPPFKGLAYYSEADADIFFGREELIDNIVDRLHENRFLAILSTSGSGKSSLIRAGIVPHLRHQNWLIHIITPTADPLGKLANSLARDDVPFSATDNLREQLAMNPQSLRKTAEKLVVRQDASRLMLIVDQFEELFTQCRDEPERRAFIGNLLTAVYSDASITLLISLRADFYSYIAKYPELHELVSEQQVFIDPLNREELLQAITEPIRLGGWQISEGLVGLILADIGHEPGQLPLLSHALLETWQRRRG